MQVHSLPRFVSWLRQQKPTNAPALLLPFAIGGRWRTDLLETVLWHPQFERVAHVERWEESPQAGQLVEIHDIELRGDCLIAKRGRVLAPVVAPWGEADFRARQSKALRATEFGQFVSQTRTALEKLALTELKTPSLVTCPGLEPALIPVASSIRRGAKSQKVFLPTSPEIHLKKALCEGWTDIFEIRSCFRDNEFGDWHEIEFTMLEWYRAHAGLDAIIEDLVGLLAALKPADATEIRITQTTFAELFRRLLDFQLTPSTTANELKELAKRVGVEVESGDTFSDVFHRLMLEKIEPELEKLGPVIVRGFPPSESALARLDSDGFADRFEFYWNGLEIANAFNEVTDPAEQLARWQRDVKERQRLGTGEVPLDEEFLESLKNGLPSTGGIALGLERLFLAIQIHRGGPHIADKVSDLHWFNMSGSL